jgi:hypothetical protein
MHPNTISPLSPETENYAPLTDFQAGQLLHIHLSGDFKYKTDAGTKVSPAAWRKMLCALIDGEYIVLRGGPRLTAHGRAWLDAHHLEIKTLA